jgi:hypothetical protein
MPDIQHPAPSLDGILSSNSFFVFFVAELFGPSFSHRAAASRSGRTARPIRSGDIRVWLFKGCAEELAQLPQL